MATITIRIVIPTSVGDILALSSRILNKHQADGSSSPLHALTDSSWDEYAQKIQEAQQKHNEAEALMRRAEQAYRERDQILKELKNLIKRTRDLLKALFPKMPKKLGEWGFEVNDTPRVAKLK